MTTYAKLMLGLGITATLAFFYGAGKVGQAFETIAAAEKTVPAGRTTTAPTLSTSEQRAKAVKCNKVLKDAGRLGLWRKYSSSASGATVDVGPAFYGADYETKGIVNEALRCVLTDGSMDFDTVPVIVYRDWRTHQDVATWTPEMSLQVKGD